jgi:hypothetical protein
VQKSAALVKLIYDLFYTWHESFECLVVKLILWPAHGNGTLHATVGVKDWKSNACNATQIIAVSKGTWVRKYSAISPSGRNDKSAREPGPA